MRSLTGNWFALFQRQSIFGCEDNTLSTLDIIFWRGMANPQSGKVIDYYDLIIIYDTRSIHSNINIIPVIISTKQNAYILKWILMLILFFDVRMTMRGGMPLIPFG